MTSASSNPTDRIPVKVGQEILENNLIGIISLWIVVKRNSRSRRSIPKLLLLSVIQLLILLRRFKEEHVEVVHSMHERLEERVHPLVPDGKQTGLRKLLCIAERYESHLEIDEEEDHEYAEQIDEDHDKHPVDARVSECIV